MDGMPGFVTQAKNNWIVIPINAHQSKLIMKAQFRSKGLMGFLMKGMMKKKMDETLETVLNDAKVYSETGNISIAKQERMNELEEKMKRAA
jgi:response regulator of citrate/malate metabolism